MSEYHHYNRKYLLYCMFIQIMNLQRCMIIHNVKNQENQAASFLLEADTTERHSELLNHQNIWIVATTFFLDMVVPYGVVDRMLDLQARRCRFDSCWGHFSRYLQNFASGLSCYQFKLALKNGSVLYFGI